jgi:hypothetical protein
MRLTWGTTPLTPFDYVSFALVILCLLVALLRPTLFACTFGRIEQMIAGVAENRWLCAGVVFALPIALRLLILGVDPPPAPAVHDEYAYLLQSDTLASGRLANPQPPSPGQFESIYILANPSYAAEYQLGQAAFLALGQKLLASPWAGVVLSMGLFCAASYWTLMGWVSSVWAFIGALLIGIEVGVLSYWTNSYWGGFVPAIGGALLLGGLARLMSALRAREATIATFGAVLLLYSRPLEGGLLLVVAAGFFAFQLLTRNRKPAAFARRVLVPAVLVFAPALLFIGFYNYRVTGKATQLPYLLYRARYSIPQGFYWQPLTFANKPMPADIDVEYKAQIEQHERGATVAGFLRATAGKIRRFWDFFIGPVLTLVLIAIPFIWRKRNMSIAAASLFAVIVLENLTYFAYFPHYSAAVATMIFLVIIQCLQVLRGWGLWGLFLSRAIPLACCLMLAVAIVGRLSEQVWPSATLGISKLWDSQYEPVYLASREKFERPLEQERGKQLVLIRYDPVNHRNDNSWTFNMANLDTAKIVWARESRDPNENRRLINYFKDRTVWLAEPDETPKRVILYPGLNR